MITGKQFVDECTRLNRIRTVLKTGRISEASGPMTPEESQSAQKLLEWWNNFAVLAKAKQHAKELQDLQKGGTARPTPDTAPPPRFWDQVNPLDFDKDPDRALTLILGELRKQREQGQLTKEDLAGTHAEVKRLRMVLRTGRMSEYIGPMTAEESMQVQTALDDWKKLAAYAESLQQNLQEAQKRTQEAGKAAQSAAPESPRGRAKSTVDLEKTLEAVEDEDEEVNEWVGKQQHFRQYMRQRAALLNLDNSSSMQYPIRVHAQLL